MIIDVVGGTKVQRKHAKSMVEFCVETLMPKMETLDIEVKLCKLDNALGYCLETDDKRTFEIEISGHNGGSEILAELVPIGTSRDKSKFQRMNGAFAVCRALWRTWSRPSRTSSRPSRTWPRP